MNVYIQKKSYQKNHTMCSQSYFSYLPLSPLNKQPGRYSLFPPSLAVLFFDPLPSVLTILFVTDAF